MNQAVARMFHDAQEDIRKDMPGFDAERLIGSNIDTFHKNPAHQREMLGRLKGTHRATIKLGGRTFSLAVTPVVNERGDRLGTAVEWQDRTAEVAIENEVADLVSSAASGDFTKRLATEGKQGFFRELANGLNQLVDVVSSGLNDVARVLNGIAKGHLTERIEANYSGTFGQLKDDTNTTVERLRETVLRIKESSEAINTAAQEIAVGNQDLSSRTEEQASSLEETASSMEELNATVKQNAENARQANELAGASNAIAARGGEVVKQVVHTMSGIQESSKKIADIIGVIDSIAFQTNILALNAAVEAARAGEQGRGFAVVASEVRNLAQRSATAAKEIKSLIADSVDKVENGAKQVAEAGNTMDEVVASIHRVTKLVNDITAASREQSSGIEQVTNAVSQMDEVTQQNAALVEEAAAAAATLEEQARTLVQAVSMFRLAAGDAQVAEPSLRAELAPVTRIPAARDKAAPRKTSAPLPKVRKVAGGAETEDEWEEF
jgi:methyl-accepting chemotaxis protein